MSQRTRYLVIIVILLVVIGVGGGLIYYFSRPARQAVTGAGLAIDVAGKSAVVPPDQTNQYGDLSRGQAAIGWLRCNDPYDEEALYQRNKGDSIKATFECQNIDTDSAHAIEVDHYDLPMVVYNDPSNACLEQKDISRFPIWPPDHTFTQMLPIAANHTFIGNAASATCPVDDDPNIPGPQDSEQPLQTTSTSKVNFNPGQTVQFEVTHSYNTCNYYQIDDVAVELDQNGNRIPGNAVILLGTVVRSQGDSATCPKPQELGNFEVRIFEDIDGNQEYSTATAGGTDNPFAGETPVITDNQGKPVTGCSGSSTGGAGRISCYQVPIGQYTVETTNPNATLYQGPIVDPHDNPAPNEKHNATGSPKLTLTVVPGPQPTGTGGDIVTYFDFGYLKKDVTASLGNLEMRVYNDLDKNNEYSTPAAGCSASVCDEPFAFFGDFTVKNAAGQDIIAQGLCDQAQGTKTGGAGRFDCWQIPTGKYTIESNNPDPTKYNGPVQDHTANPAPGEEHNAKGEAKLSLTVLPGAAPKGVGNDIITFFDYGYRAKAQGPIVAGTAQPCTLDKTVSDASSANEESPDNPKRSVSSSGEQLDFSLGYNCKGTGSATTVPTGTTIILTDSYDDTLTMPIDSSITASGRHDPDQHTISWTLQAGDALTGTVKFSSRIDVGLAAGTYTSPNDVSISRNNEVEDQDQTITTITVGAVTNEPAPINNLPPAGNLPRPTPTGNVLTPTPTPTTGVGANLAILLISLLAAAAITTFAVARLKFKRT
ncbi:MAG: hypothetical protein V1895_02140 [Parcubacteria group bacterium]